MIKKIQVELAILIVLLVSVLLSHKADTIIYNYFFNFNYGFQTANLKNFFIEITELGDSLWCFLIILSIFILSVVFKKIKILSPENCLRLRNFSFFCFLYIFLVGLVTQALKHIIGRSRPNHMDFEKVFNFNFFSIDSSFHSFPSGHSSTIIALALILGLLIPGLKIFFLLLGLVVSLSRVVVGAHFTSDIIAGALVAIIMYKLLLSFLEERYPIMSPNNFELKSASLLLKTNVVFLVMGVFISVGYSFDVFVSDLFYFDNAQFFLQSYSVLSVFFRDILLPFLIVYLFFLPILGNFLPIHQFYLGHKFSFKEIVFIWLTGISTLVLIVNVLLKNMWGRARPNDILQFGGNEVFTPWYKFGESCVSNCSFVSGDASVGFALIIFYFITKKNIYIYLSVLLGVCLGFIRIIAGGHFLSDVIFCQIVVTSTIFASFIIYKKFLNE